MFLEGWLHSIESDRTSILSSQQDWCRPNVLRPDVPSCFMHELCMTRYTQVDRIRILVIFDLQVSIPNWWWNVNCLCISELFKDIQDAILLVQLYRTMWLFRATSSSTLMMSDVQSFLKNQYSTGIFSCFLLLLPWFSSICYQTNEGNTGNISKDCL